MDETHLRHHLDEREGLIQQELREHESNTQSELRRHRQAIAHIETTFRLRLGAEPTKESK